MRNSSPDRSEMAPRQQTDDRLIDDAPTFAARELAGCFTLSQVHERLGQPVTAGEIEREITEDCSKYKPSDLLGNHSLPGCVCSPLHAQCDGILGQQEATEPSIEVTLEQLRDASDSGCSFCSTMFGASWPRRRGPQALRHQSQNSHRSSSMLPLAKVFILEWLSSISEIQRCYSTPT